MGPGYYGWGHGFFWVFPLLFVVFVVIVMWAMLRRGGMCGMWMDRTSRGLSDSRHETAREILDRRYASGEIGKE